MRRGWCSGLVALVLGGCASEESGSAHPSIWIDKPEGECSDVTRALARAQGREVKACGPSALRFQNLVPLGDGHVLVWVPDTGEYVLWKLDAKGEFLRWPVSAGTFQSIRTNRVLTALPGGLVFDYENQGGALTIYKADVGARGTDPLPRTALSAPLLPRAAWSMTPVALDAAHLLEVRGSDGSYDVVQVADGVTRIDNVGKNPYFRRGHRLVWLGAQRLLEWEPVGQSYRIWRYDTSRLPEGLFEPDPIAEGVKPDELVGTNEIWTLADDQIGIWDRDKGVLRVRELDPLAADPLAGRPLNEISDDRFRSPLPGAEQPTTTGIRRLVILFQDGRSFDSTFGNYCQAPARSAPSCNSGPACCEARPEQPAAHACDPVDPSTSAYHALAAEGALADRYFASARDDAFTNLNVFQFGFPAPEGAGATLDTVGGLLAKRRVPFALYLLPENLELFEITTPDYADSSWGFFRTLDEFEYDVESEQLPQISVILPNGTAFSELPGEGRSLGAGTEFTTRVVRSVLDSPSYRGDTVVLVTHVLGGGCTDHIPFPGVPRAEPNTAGYGGRVPLLALGPFVRRNYVSHVLLEHVSLSAFIEWNFLGPREVGALRQRDAEVNNLGDLFEPDLRIPSLIEPAAEQP